MIENIEVEDVFGGNRDWLLGMLILNSARGR
ncbi:hypothetical protein BH11PLA2_BH11PLA2_50390 [soil metagenome]